MVSFNFGSSSRASTSQVPADHPPIPAGAAGGADQCPVDHTTRSKWLEASEDQAAANNPFYQTTSVRPTSTLSKQRAVSSIPRAGGDAAAHVGSSEGRGNDDNPNWVYPSEEQFFKAMQRKNHQPRAGDMRTVVPIHNAVNEKAWEEILMWEVGMGSDKCGGPRLISFAGKPKQRTPKAWINTALGYTPPFDRHDWIIDRCGKQVRYVIDFYSGKQEPGQLKNISFYLDVRPALDDAAHIETRLKGWWRQLAG